MNYFKYYDEEILHLHTQAYFASIPCDIIDKEQLLSEFSLRLKFPSYFGFNWDALNDCLGDLSWIDQHEIIICHEDLPCLSNDDMSIYLDILNGQISDWGKWQDGKVHHLRIYFPGKYKLMIEEIMKSFETGTTYET